MSDKPRRRWIQFHLLTAVVMMFVAGGMMFAFFRYCKFLSIQSQEHWFNMQPGFGIIVLLLVVFCCPVLILYVTMKFCEFVIRHREGRKP